jgi:cytochrome c
MKKTKFWQNSSVRFAIFLLLICLTYYLWINLLRYGGDNELRSVDSAIAITSGGKPMTGYKIILSVGCGGCHEIPGIPAAHGKIGPSLGQFKDRAMIAGVLANSPDNLIHWIQHPREVNPMTAMPDLNISEEQARDIAAYLYAPHSFFTNF